MRGEGGGRLPPLFYAIKNLVVAAFVLLLAYYGPQRDAASRFDVAWMLGALALLAVSLGQVVEAARLPALLGWLVAGLVLGARAGLCWAGAASLAIVACWLLEPMGRHGPIAESDATVARMAAASSAGSSHRYSPLMVWYQYGNPLSAS